jgi:hypothetical protein
VDCRFFLPITHLLFSSIQQSPAIYFAVGNLSNFARHQRS